MPLVLGVRGGGGEVGGGGLFLLFNFLVVFFCFRICFGFFEVCVHLVWLMGGLWRKLWTLALAAFHFLILIVWV